MVQLRLQPIRVFCFHHVSDVYNPLTMWKCDWTQTELFKRNILHLKEQGYVFISLAEAYSHITKDRFRTIKYAVLTADDGYKSLLNILPWLADQHIPITLFVNTKYLDGKSWSSINEAQARRAKPDVDMLTEVCPDLYMSKEELFSLTSSLVSIGMHGHEHLDATMQTLEDFRNNVELCRDVVMHHPRYVPFFAYPWDLHSDDTDNILNEIGIIPVLVSGVGNYSNADRISRECFDGISV